MSLVRFYPENYFTIIKSVETLPIVIGSFATPALNYIGIGTGLDAVEYYGEVHLSYWNSVMHTMGMPFTSYGIVLALPALFNLDNDSANYLQKCVFIVYRSSKACVGCSPDPSPALINGTFVYVFISSKIPFSGCLITSKSQYASIVLIVSLSDSPFFELEYS